jgi:NAD(P)-dependent dehydrogenase (short-subunit alcohol dehydrogenase family)
VETLDLMLATNVRGMFFSMKHELEIMAKQGFGSIVNISSGAGLTGVPGYAGTENPELHEHLVASHPLGRIAEPEEVADAIVWLATNKSSYVTGVALPVDGGYLAR